MGLAYPGVPQGFDPSYFATANCRFYAVATGGGNFRQIFGATPGIKGTVSGPTFFMDGIIGPSAKFVEANFADNVRFANQATNADTSITIGVIVSNIVVNATIKYFFGTDGAGITNGWAFAKDVSQNLIVAAAGAVSATSSGITLVGSVPYFLAVSANATIANFVAVKLLTGQTFTSSVTATKTAAAPNGTYVVGNNGSGVGFGGNMSEAMASAVFLSVPQLKQWAADLQPYGWRKDS